MIYKSNSKIYFKIIIGLIMVLFIACGKSVPQEIELIVFEQSFFSKPISVSLPCDDSASERWVAEYCNSSIKSGLYAAPIGYNSKSRLIDEGFLKYLEAKKLVTIKNYSTTNSYGRFDYPVMIYNSEIKKYLVDPNSNCNNWRFKLAIRTLKRIDYTNEYESEPYGLGVKMKTFSLRFIYEVVPELSNAKVKYEEFDGSAKVLLNPDTGKWQLENLELDKREENSLQVDY